MTPRILVIIVSYNAMPWLDRCLGSVRQSSLPADVLMVDNGSTDGTPEHVRGNYPEVRLLVQDGNLGFGRANNAGLKIALDEGYDYVYLLNQDAWIFPDTLSLLVGAMRKAPDFGILSPMQLAADGRLDSRFARHLPEKLRGVVGASSEELRGVAGGSSGESRKTAVGAGDSRSADCRSDEQLDIGTGSGRPVDVKFAMAAHWLMSMDAVRKVGGFCPAFTHYGEDDNYIDRLHYHGLRCGVVPAAKAVHDRSQRRPPKAARVRLKCVAAVVGLCNPCRPMLFSGLVEPLRLICIAAKNLSLIPLKELPRLLRRYPEFRRARTESKRKGAFL